MQAPVKINVNEYVVTRTENDVTLFFLSCHYHLEEWEEINSHYQRNRQYIVSCSTCTACLKRSEHSGTSSS